MKDIDLADVAIVGAGAAGCLLAILLGRAGRRVLLLERSPKPPFNGADFLKPSGIKVLARNGLLDEIAQHDVLRRSRILYYHGGAPIIDYDYAAHTDVGYFLIVPHATTMSVLLEAIRPLPGVELRVNTEVSTLTHEGGHVQELVLQNGRRVHAKVIVGADGAHSTLRAAVGLPDERMPFDQDVYMATYPMVPSVETCNRLYIATRRQMVYLYPATRTHFRFCLSMPSSEAAVFAGSASALIERIRPFVTESDDALAAIGDLSAFVRMPTAHMNASRYFCGNAVLLGDAAHAGHPVTGQGLNLAFEDVEALAACLLAFFESRAPLDGALTRYEQIRRPINGRIIDYGKTLLRCFEDRDWYLAHFDAPLHGSAYELPRIGEFQ